MHQVRILGRGDTWASHDNVRICEQEWKEIKSSCRETTNSPSCFSKDRDTTHSSYNITFSSMEDVIQTDPQLMSASDNKIFSKDSCSSKGEESTHSSHKVTPAVAAFWRICKIVQDMTQQLKTRSLSYFPMVRSSWWSARNQSCSRSLRRVCAPSPISVAACPCS